MTNTNYFRANKVNRRVLVAGGCGFIGHRVVGRLLEAGFDPHVIDICTDYGALDPHQHARNIETRKERMQGAPIHNIDICDHDSLANFCRELRPATVIHLASVPIAKVALERPLFAGKQLTLGTISLLDAARSAGVERFVYVSSSMVYGDFEAEAVDETHAQRPRDPYGSLKLAAEHLTRSYTIQHGLEHVIVRPTAVYGPTGNSSFVITKFVQAAKRGGVIRIQGDQTRLDFTFVDDAARGICLAATSPQAANETFNISFGQSRTLLDAAEHLKTLAAELKFEVVGADPLYPRRGTLSISKAQAIMGYRPEFSLERGLDEFYANF
jgi:UDP-glucose 4-epimerase